MNEISDSMLPWFQVALIKNNYLFKSLNLLPSSAFDSSITNDFSNLGDFFCSEENKKIKFQMF